MRTNIIIAVSIIVALTLWMLLGSSSSGETSGPQENQSDEESLPKVRTRISIAESQTEEISLRGKTQAARETILKAEIGSVVVATHIRRGEAAKAGELLLSLDKDELPQELEAAKALVTQRELEHKGVKKLESTGFQSGTRLAEAAALLEQAKTQQAQIEELLKKTEIRAPYDGVLNERLVEIGSFAASGDPLIHFLELSPMIIVADASEKEIQKIALGQSATATIGDKEVTGTIRYRSLAADEATRTYVVELEFENDQNFSTGFTANVQIPVGSSKAHFVTPSLLYLSANTQGDLGLKIVDAESKVRFHPTKILSGERDGVWVSGLPETVKLITVGQGFVKPGSKVDPVDEATIEN